jgi:hypothetical protein
VIELPDFERAWDYENNFYLSCPPSRMGKVLAHYELYDMTRHVPGALVECGVFKGASFVRFAMFRALLGPAARDLVGFDVFGTFPPSRYAPDLAPVERFTRSAGDQSIGLDQLRTVLARKGVDDRVELVEGDVMETVPAYVARHPGLQIALLNLDVDTYEPSAVILEHLYPRIVPGGVLVLDDYQVIPGETKAVDDYFKGQNVRIEKFPFAATPWFLRKT